MNNDCQSTTPTDCPLKGKEGRDFWQEFGEMKTIAKSTHDLVEKQNGRIHVLEVKESERVGGGVEKSQSITMRHFWALLIVAVAVPILTQIIIKVF
jgi:hypothetical protein